VERKNIRILVGQGLNTKFTLHIRGLDIGNNLVLLPTVIYPIDGLPHIVNLKPSICYHRRSLFQIYQAHCSWLYLHGRECATEKWHNSNQNSYGMVG